MCWVACQEGRTVQERFHILCITCVVLDSNWALLDGRAALDLATRPINACYEEHGYGNHNVTAGVIFVSSMIALLGVHLHSKVVCNEPTESSLSSISYFAHGLIGWTFVAVILEAIAYGNGEPPQACDYLNNVQRSGEEVPGDSLSADGYSLWHVGMTVLWLVWITCVVSASFLAKKLNLQQGSRGSRGGSGTTASTPAGRPAADPCGVAQIVGTPITEQNGASGAAAASAVGMDGVAMGMPVGGATGSAPSGSSGGGKVV